MVMDLVSAVACETTRSASRIERLARTFIWVIPFRGWKVCDDGWNDEARWGTKGPFPGLVKQPRCVFSVQIASRPTPRRSLPPQDLVWRMSLSSKAWGLADSTSKIPRVLRAIEQWHCDHRSGAKLPTGCTIDSWIHFRIITQ